MSRRRTRGSVRFCMCVCGYESNSLSLPPSLPPSLSALVSGTEVGYGAPRGGLQADGHQRHETAGAHTRARAQTHSEINDNDFRW
eukprot:1502354-Rhodomonas_salina.2